jgi:hypothetical protein
VLKFLVFKDGSPVGELDVTSAHMLGPDDVPIKSQVRYADRLLVCQKTTEEAAALAILWEVKGAGKYLLQTTRLPSREKPYILNVELARWRLMRILSKLEDWGLFEYPKTEAIYELLETSRKLFINALQESQTPAQAAELADKSLQKSMEAGDALAKFHSSHLLGAKLQSGALNRKLFGSRINPGVTTDQLSPELLATLNFVQIPLNWAELHTAKQQFNLAPLDRQVEFFLKRKISIRFGSVVSFAESNIPAWVKGKTLEYEALRELVYEYLTAIASRYGKCIRSWAVVSGLHADNYFGLNFEQILDITRLASTRAKQLCPRASAVIEIIYPWGEYFARTPKTIHPFLYADMVSQSGINFDAFALRLPFGAAKDGFYVRDLFQLSSLIDRYALGKPIHLTTAVPATISDATGDCGYFSMPWTPETQAKWFEYFCQIALSKPLIESITWETLCDAFSENIPESGLFDGQWNARPILNKIRDLQKRLLDTKEENPAQ